MTRLADCCCQEGLQLTVDSTGRCNRLAKSFSHRDSAGGQGRPVAGDVQVMSAGTGIRHEERNTELVPLRLFQIWLQPRKWGGEPRCRSQLASSNTSLHRED